MLKKSYYLTVVAGKMATQPSWSWEALAELDKNSPSDVLDDSIVFFPRLFLDVLQ